MRKLVFCLLVIASALLSSCRSRADEESPIVEASPPASTLTAALPTASPLPALSPTSPQATAETPAVSPTAVPSPREPVLGIHIDNFASGDPLAAFPRPDQLWTRFDQFHWDAIEPQQADPPAYDWSAIDEAALARVGGSGMRVIGLVLMAPGWAQKYPPSACGPIAENALERYGQFLNALVSRYSQPPYNVHYWELGNEPDVDRSLVAPDSGFGCWGEGNDPYYGGGYYAEMLKVAYPQVKAADPAAQVIVGGLLLNCDPVNPPEKSPGVPANCVQSRFLEGILANGGGEFFDGVSYHSYDYYMNAAGQYSNVNWHSSWETTGPVLIAKTRFLRGLLEQGGQANKLLLNTELALICGRDGSEPECQTDEYLQSKANYLAQAAAIGLAEGLDVNIWYSLQGWRGSGLVNANLEPTPAYQAFLYVSERFSGAEFQSENTAFAGVKGLEFTRDGARFWLLWSQDGQPRDITLPDTPAAIFDVFGAARPAERELQVTLAPVFIDWQP